MNEQQCKASSPLVERYLDVQERNADGVEPHCQLVVRRTHLVVVVRVDESQHRCQGVRNDGDQGAQHPPAEELDLVPDAQPRPNVRKFRKAIVVKIVIIR